MNSRRKEITWLSISIISYFLLSVTFLFMPIEDLIPSLDSKTVSVIISICFWLFLMIGVLSQIILSRMRKKWYLSRHWNERRSSAKYVGLLAFFSNKYAALADLTVVASFIGLVIAMIATDSRGYICYVFFAILCFSFCMHCVLNGKVFYHITQHYKRISKNDTDKPNEDIIQKENINDD